MKKLFFCGFLSLLFISCEKEVRKDNSANYDQTLTGNSTGKKAEALTKSFSMPTFDYDHPISSYDDVKQTTIVTYLEAGYVDGDKDFWASHEFTFSDSKTIKLIYHYVVADDKTSSEVYSLTGEYLFTFIDDDGTVSVESNSMSPFTDCIMRKIRTRPEQYIAFGNSVLTYWVYLCYQQYSS